MQLGALVIGLRVVRGAEIAAKQRPRIGGERRLEQGDRRVVAAAGGRQRFCLERVGVGRAGVGLGRDGAASAAAKTVPNTVEDPLTTHSVRGSGPARQPRRRARYHM